MQILKNETSHAKFNNIQKVLLGGAEIPHGLLQPIKGLKRKVYYGYGMTETASHIALTEIHDTDEGFDVLPGVEIQIGHEGIIVISIPAFNLQISTHDIGNMENNKLVVLGRKEHYINSGGVKIHANELEGIISKVLEGRVKDISFVVLGLPHPVLGEAISVITEKKAIASEMRNVINEEIVLKLGAKFKVLNWSCVDEFPRINQKIDKRQLKATTNERVKGR